MIGRIRLHDRHQELRVFRFRSALAAFVCVALLAVLAARMVYLQVISHELFSSLSQDNRLQVVPLPPTRGLIYDRNGVVLAENIPSHHLTITPEKIRDLDETLADLAEVVTVRPSDVERFRQALKRHRPFESVPLRVNLGEEEVARFSVNRHRFPGVDIEPQLTRYYPYGERTAHVLGYVGRIDEHDLKRLDERNYRGTNLTGKLGVERQYEAELHGRVGYMHQEVNVEGRKLRELEGRRPPVPGADLQLNLDMRLQQTAWQALGEEAGAVVAIDPANGAVLAFVSRPSFDPHDFVHGISDKDYRALRDDPQRPLFNRALRGQYPPGSTIKPFLGLGALERAHELAGQSVHCRGYYKLPTDKRRYRDWKTHGKVDLDEAIAQSCDVFFYDLAHRMGIDKMAAYLGLFGLGRASGIDIPGEREGLVPTREWKRNRFSMPWFPGETLIAGIGQGYMLATPLQLADAVSGLAVGRLYRPRVAAFLERPGGRIERIEPVLRAELPVVEPAHWERIRRAMEDVVHGKRGTARASGYGAGYRFAGKTGTSQVISIAQDAEYDAEALEKKYHDHALFIAWAPVDNPRIAVGVLVEHGGSGSSAAAPVARKVFDTFFEVNGLNGNDVERGP